jgi:hypothetical protein
LLTLPYASAVFTGDLSSDLYRPDPSSHIFHPPNVSSSLSPIMSPTPFPTKNPLGNALPSTVPAEVQVRPFLSLPAEIRLMIYRIMLPGDFFLDNYPFKSTLLLSLPRALDGGCLKKLSKEEKSRARACVNAMATCRYIRQELGSLFYDKMAFSFSSMSKTSTKRLNAYSRVLTRPLIRTICIGVGDMMASSKVRLTSSNNAARFLAGLPSLNTLWITYEMPRDLDEDLSDQLWDDFLQSRLTTGLFGYGHEPSDFNLETIQWLVRIQCSSPRLRFISYDKSKPFWYNSIRFSANPETLDHRSLFSPKDYYSQLDTVKAQIFQVKQFFELKHRTRSQQRDIQVLVQRILDGDAYQEWVFAQDSNGQLHLCRDLNRAERRSCVIHDNWRDLVSSSRSERRARPAHSNYGE